MTIRERIESWPDDPECDGTDAAHPAYWRGHDHAVAVLCQKVAEILDGKDDGKGIASQPWEPVRLRKKWAGVFVVARGDSGVVEELRWMAQGVERHA